MSKDMLDYFIPEDWHAPAGIYTVTPYALEVKGHDNIVVIDLVVKVVATEEYRELTIVSPFRIHDTESTARWLALVYATATRPTGNVQRDYDALVKRKHNHFRMHVLPDGTHEFFAMNHVVVTHSGYVKA